ncbi:MAG: LicD family protein [Prevotella sp.]|nr:LicD family protein [Prevotella sp.]
MQLSITPEELRQRFNPDDSLLRRQQMRMLEILLEVDRICKKHKIPYWLGSGTLLGAMRHRGFIPWDDDLDIEMLWEDYQRLLKVLPVELPPNMALQCTQTDRNYFYFYAKVRDRRSHLEEVNRYDRFWKEQGVYIDVFPVHRHPIWLHLLSEKLQGHVYKIIRQMGEDDKEMWKVRLITRMNEKVLYPMMRAFSRLLKAKGTLGFGIPFHSPRPIETILPLTEAEFEGHTFPVPNDSHTLLTLLYGDYMQLPDVNKLQLHVGKLEIYDE